MEFAPAVGVHVLEVVDDAGDAIGQPAHLRFAALERLRADDARDAAPPEHAEDDYHQEEAAAEGESDAGAEEEAAASEGDSAVLADADPEGLRAWYLGCNGFVLKADDGTTVFVDPYLGTGDPPRTIPIETVPRGDASEARRLNVRSVPSSEGRVVVQLRDFEQ